MKRLFQIIALIVVALIIMTAVSLYVSLYPRLKNMGSEYGTAQAIRDIEAYLRQNQGEWPSSPAQLGDQYPSSGEVVIDYSATSKELIAAPEKLRDAVHPRSGKFYTYPHYDSQLDGLLLTLQETNISEQDGTGQPATCPESKSEGSDKPQPEAEGRSR